MTATPYKGITLVVCSRRQSPHLANTLRHYIRTSGLAKKQIQLLSVISPTGLSKAYNQALQHAHYDVVCCFHDDLRFERNSHWGKQILGAFRKSTFAALSAAGSVSLANNGVFWHHREHLVGRIKHCVPVAKGALRHKVYPSYYSQAFRKPLPVVVLDGLMLALCRSRLKYEQPFDEDFNFHFYDLAFSLRQSLAKPQSCGVLTRLKITHKSLGTPNQHYFELRKTFEKKYRRHLPAFSKPSLNVHQTRSQIASVTTPLHVLLLSQQNKWPDLITAIAPHTHQVEQWSPHQFSHATLNAFLQGLPKPSAVYIHHENIRFSLAHWQMLYARWKILQEQKEACIVSPRLHYADTHLLYHAGITKGVHTGMHQPYNYSLGLHEVDETRLHCAFLSAGNPHRSYIDGSIWALWCAD